MLQMFAIFKYAPEWKSRFTFGLNAAKIPIILKTTPNKGCLKLNFLQKTQKRHISISLGSGAKERQTFAIF